MRLVRPFLAALRARGALPEPLVRLEARGPDEQVSLAEALRWLDHEELGCAALAFVEPGTCDITECVAASARDFGEALESIVAYAPILCDAAAYSIQQRQGKVLLELATRVPLNRPAAEFQAGLVALAARSWLGGLSGCEFWFSHGAPARPAAQRKLFAPAQLRFRAPCDALVFEPRLLRVPLPKANPALHRVLRRYADQLVPSAHSAHPLSERVQELVLELLKEGKSEIRLVAARLGMSRRTLARHLRREGVRYRDFVEEARARLARQHLAMSAYDVKQIAGLLGYSESAAFSRAFRRWSGQSPGAYRKLQHDDQPRSANRLST